MNKITKRIMALMLSLVMLLGCIPCNIASATEVSEWTKLSRAMYEDGTEKIDGLFDLSNNETTNTRTITLLKDITAESTDKALQVTNTTTKIVLDLNGHILNRGLIDSDGTAKTNENGSVIEIIGGDLTIIDNNQSVEHKGKIVDGLWVPTEDGDTIIKGGIITGGTGKKKGADSEVYEGGGVIITRAGTDEIGKLTLTAGTIAGNIARGGGVKIQNNSSFEMNGGAISYNKATDSAAGILCEYSTIFTMNGGEISYNTANGTAGVGGIHNAGTSATINGGKIIYNKAEGYAGGVYTGNNKLTISGNAIIKDNINTQKTDDISWPQNLTTPGPAINVSNLGNAEIYISFLDYANGGHKEGKLTSGCNGKGLNEVFFYDGPDTFYMDYDTNGELVVKAVPANSYKINVIKPENGSVTPDILCAEQGATITLTTTPESGYAFDEYIVLKESGDAIDVVDNKFIMPESSVLVSATFKAMPVSSSKKYKAKDSNSTIEKISGSGKKGSTRTITTFLERAVSEVIVTDKKGNTIETTKVADGIYSFVQPASDVNIEVIYRNREITLNIGSTEASVDNEKTNLDVCPVIRNDRTMLPIRFVAENLGAKVEWSEKNPNYVLITKGDIKIEITLGSDIMKVNGKDVKLDSVAFAENDRTYLPVRAVSENLNAIVEWNETRPMEVKIYER